MDNKSLDALLIFIGVLLLVFTFILAIEFNLGLIPFLVLFLALFFIVFGAVELV